MKLIDISVPIYNQMVVYKDREEKRPMIKPMKTFENADFYESRIDMDLHTGTHVDTPLHMVKEGQTMDQIPLDTWHGQAKVFDLSHLEDGITKADIENLNISQGDIVLFKTRNSFEDFFNMSFIYVKADAAQYLGKIGVKGVGIDALGIERAQPNHESHLALFEAGAFILEGINLKHVQTGSYYLMALPLALVGVEASPVRAVLIQNE